VRRSLAWPAVLAAALGLVLAFGARPAVAQTADCAVVLDASGSMRGFAPAGGASTLGAILADLRRACPEGFAFGDRFRSWNGQVNAQTFSDVNTRLGEALTAWRQRSPHGVAVFVTDNVADSGHGNSDQDVFYRGLHEPPPGFRFVAVVLARLNFNGQVFPLGTGHGTAYRGPRALAFYVLAPSNSERGAAVLRSLEAALQQAGLDRAGAGAAGRSYTVAQLAPLALVRESRVPIRLSGAEGAQATPEGDGVLVNPGTADAQPQFTVEVQPRFSSDWRVRQIHLSAQLRFDASDEFGAASTTDCTTQPDTLTPQTLGQPVDITCRPAPLGPALNDVQRRVLEGRGTSYREGRLVLLASVEQTALEMAGGLRGWTYDGPAANLGNADPAVQGGIFNLGTLLTRMIPQRTITAEIAETRVVQRVWLINPGHWALVIVALLGLALLAGLIFLAVRKRDYEFTGDASSPSVIKSMRVGESMFLEPVGGGGLVTVRVLGFGFLLSGRGRDPVRPSFLPWGGGRFSQGSDGQNMSVKPVRARRETKRDGRRGGRSSSRRRDGGSRR
jgi:hypothetical protein